MSRKIVVGGETYTYRIGRGNVSIRDQANRHIVASFEELKDMHPFDVERGIWKGTFHITPADIRAFLEGERKDARK